MRHVQLDFRQSNPAVGDTWWSPGLPDYVTGAGWLDWYGYESGTYGTYDQIPWGVGGLSPIWVDAETRYKQTAINYAHAIEIRVNAKNAQGVWYQCHWARVGGEYFQLTGCAKVWQGGYIPGISGVHKGGFTAGTQPSGSRRATMAYNPQTNALQEDGVGWMMARCANLAFRQNPAFKTPTKPGIYNWGQGKYSCHWKNGVMKCTPILTSRPQIPYVSKPFFETWVENSIVPSMPMKYIQVITMHPAGTKIRAINGARFRRGGCASGENKIFGPFATPNGSTFLCKVMGLGV